MAINYDVILQEFLALEREQRELAFIAAPGPVVAGQRLAPFTLRQWSLLQLVDSPFLSLCASEPDPEITELLPAYFRIRQDLLVQALWLLSEEYHRPSDKRPVGYRQARFIRQCAEAIRPDLKEVIASVIRYITSAFADAPPSSPRDSSESVNPLAAAEAYIVHRLAAGYHWSESAILALPLPRVWQYLRLLEQAADPDRHIVQGSDVARGRYTEQYRDHIRRYDYTQSIPQLDPSLVLLN